MQKQDVPQDNSPHYIGHDRATYAVDESGSYVKANSSGWDVETTVNSLALEDIENKREEVRKKVISRELSPLAYHMENSQMTPRLLSAHVGVWQWVIRRHMRAENFEKISEKYLKKYSKGLNISVEELRKI